MARYDGVANWYGAYVSNDAAGFTATVGGAVARLLGQRVVHPGYRDAGWHRDGPGLGPGLRRAPAFTTGPPPREPAG